MFYESTVAQGLREKLLTSEYGYFQWRTVLGIISGSFGRPKNFSKLSQEFQF